MYVRGRYYISIPCCLFQFNMKFNNLNLKVFKITLQFQKMSNIEILFRGQFRSYTFKANPTVGPNQLNRIRFDQKVFLINGRHTSYFISVRMGLFLFILFNKLQMSRLLCVRTFCRLSEAVSVCANPISEYFTCEKQRKLKFCVQIINGCF